MSERGKENRQLMQAATCPQADIVLQRVGCEHRDRVNIRKAICFSTCLWQPLISSTPYWCRFSAFLSGSDGGKWPHTLFRSRIKDLYSHLWTTRNSFSPIISILSTDSSVPGVLREGCKTDLRFCVFWVTEYSSSKTVFFDFSVSCFFDIYAAEWAFFSVTTA